MLEEDIKKYYNKLSPSEELRREVIANVRAAKKRRAAVRFALQSICSAAACFLLAIGINFVALRNTLQAVDENIATVMAQPNGYILAGIVFAVLLTLFTGRYVTKQRNEHYRQHMEERNG